MPTTAPGETRRRRQVAHDAERSLRDSAYQLRGVHCEFANGTLLLQGRVSCFYHKQIAQTLVRQVALVERVVNSLEVLPPQGRISSIVVAE